MKTDKELKELVKEKYSEIASQSKEQNETSCCGAGSSCCGPEGEIDYTIFSEDYSKLEGYNPDADLGLGCGIPTEWAGIKKGDVVLDLGSGAGNDCFVARTMVGDEGLVIGLDMTNTMIDKAKANAEKIGFKNVEFVKGEIENIPIKSSSVDVIISNCVLNLVPDKQQAFDEIFRVLKNGGKFSISDVVITGKLPDTLKDAAEMYAGCVSGAIPKGEYIETIFRAGFSNISLNKEKQVEIPKDILSNYISNEEIEAFEKSNIGIYSISISAEKNNEDQSGCCGGDNANSCGC